MFACFGCDQGRTKSASPSATLLKIAVIPKATNHEFWKSVHAGALQAEHDLAGVQILWQGPAKEDDRIEQINVVETAITAGVDGIVLAPLDDRALIRPARDAMQAGIPVVVMDSGLAGAAGRDFVSYVATDNRVGGRRAALLMGELLDGKGDIIVMRYQLGSASTTNREDGFLEAMAQTFPRIRVVSDDQYGGATIESCRSKAESLLSRIKGIDGVFCACEPALFGVLLAARDAGLAGKIKLVGFDTSSKLIEAMRAGEVHGLVLQDPVNIGYLGVAEIVKHIRGEQIPERIDTGSVVATPANMDEPEIAKRLHPPIAEEME